MRVDLGTRLLSKLLIVPLLLLASGLVVLVVDRSGLAGPVLLLVVLVIFGVLWRAPKGNKKSFGTYKSVEAYFVREHDQVWSSHLDGSLPQLASGFVKRIVGWAPNGVKLVSSDEDRRRVRELSLRAFKNMLGELANKPGSVIVSASHLNRASRNPSRIQERINVVANQPGWTYRLCTRKLTWYESLWGRWCFKWAVEPDLGESFFKVVVDGIIVWRLADKKPTEISGLCMLETKDGFEDGEV